MNLGSGKKKNYENFDGFSNIQSLDSEVSCHSLRPVSYNFKEFEENREKDSKPGLVFNVFQQLDLIRAELVRVGRDIQVVHSQQDIKNVRCERLDIDSQVFDLKVLKFEKKVSGLAEKIRKTEEIIESFENLQKGLMKGEERCRNIEVKKVRIEKNVENFLNFSSNSDKK